VTNLRVDEQRMSQNMILTQGRSMSEAVMMVLTKKGVNRQEAHELLRQLTIKSSLEKRPFRDVLLQNTFIRGKLDEAEIVKALEPCNYLGTAIKQAELFANE